MSGMFFWDTVYIPHGAKNDVFSSILRLIMLGLLSPGSAQTDVG